MTCAPRLVPTLIFALTTAAVLPGCQFGARRQLDECRRISQTLRAQNDQLKDQMLAYRNQNQDFSERAVDDDRRLTQQAEAIERLERSVQAYQDERDELQTAFRELRDSLPAAIRAASSSSVSAASARAARDGDDAPEPRRFKTSSRPREADRLEGAEQRAGWASTGAEHPSEPTPTHAAP